jgi:protein gp37
MSATSSIQWTDKTWNPVRGCSVVSPGCVNCYAMKQAHRFSGKGKPYHGLTKLTKAGPQWTGAVRTVESALLEPLSWRQPARVFVNSMSDLFHEGVPDAFIDQVFATMAAGHRHTYQVLTKRADRMRAYLSDPGLEERIHLASLDRFGHTQDFDAQVDSWVYGRWPLPNVWLGVSVENQKYADERIPQLLQTPAAVRFISAEPLLGPIAIRNYLISGADPARCLNCGRGHGFTRCPNYGSIAPTDSRQPRCDSFSRQNFDIGWVIVGGESGPGARPFDVAWARSIVQQCQSAGVPVFVKQTGAIPTQQCGQCGRTVGRVTGGWVDACGPTHAALIAESQRIKDTKGGDPSEWPEDLRVRQFPEVRA